jgi:hypothetical protein
VLCCRISIQIVEDLLPLRQSFGVFSLKPKELLLERDLNLDEPRLLKQESLRFIEVGP